MLEVMFVYIFQRFNYLKAESITNCFEIDSNVVINVNSYITDRRFGAIR